MWVYMCVHVYLHNSTYLHSVPICICLSQVCFLQNKLLNMQRNGLLKFFSVYHLNLQVTAKKFNHRAFRKKGLFSSQCLIVLLLFSDREIQGLLCY